MLENSLKDKNVSKLISKVNEQRNGLVIGEKALCNEYIAIYENKKKKLDTFRMNIKYQKGNHLRLTLINTSAFENDEYVVDKLIDIAFLIYQTPELNAYGNNHVHYKDDNKNLVLHMNLFKRKKA